MDIFVQIMKEHREVVSMLKDLSEGYDEAVFKKLKASLAAHIRSEEGSIFPAMKEKEAEMIEHATEEHQEINRMLGELEQGGSQNDTFTSKIAELTKVIDDHFEEEETEMIPKAKDLFDRETVRELSAKFEEVDNRIAQKAR